MTAPVIEYCFVTPDALVNVEGEVTASGASTRLSSLAPARALRGLGYDARTYSVVGDLAPAQEAVRSAKRIVLGELFGSKEEGWAAAISAYRRLLAVIEDRPGRVVFSLADDHFAESEFLAFYREALPECLAVTTISEPLARTVGRLTSRPVVVAPEPCEGRRGAPQVYTRRKPAAPLAWLARRIGIPEDHWRLRLLWFGYPQSLPPLLELLPALESLSRRQPLRLTLVTKHFPELAALATPERARAGALFQLNFAPWSPFVMDSMIAQCDMVLIPAAYRDPARQSKSPNRLVAALHGGRFVIAHPMPAYAPYAEFAWIGDDLCAGLEWAIRHPREVLERIVRGQARIDQVHAPEAIARFWLDVFHPKN
jgi:hypothetical protein